MSDVKRWVVKTYEYDDALARAERAEAERDRLKARGDLYSELAEALGDDPCDSHKSRVEHAKKLKAECAALTAKLDAIEADPHSFSSEHPYCDVTSCDCGCNTCASRAALIVEGE